jgi:hypothetical protein
MQHKTKLKLNMFLCKNIIIKEHFIKILKTKFLKEIITCRLLYKCKINLCCPKFCKEDKEILAKKGKVNISI